MKNKILLINTIPSSLSGQIYESNIPPGLLTIGTWLAKKSKFTIKIIDCIVEKNYSEMIKAEIEKGDVFLVGLSVMTFCIPNALEVTRLVKKLDSSIKIIWGGIHCKLYPEQTINHPLIDFVAYDEGEKPMLNLADCIFRKKSYTKIKGIIYKENGKIIRNIPEEPLDLNELGILKYELLNPVVFKSKLVRFQTSRGCPHRCTFCINFITKNNRWRALNAENIVREVEFLRDKYGIKIVEFNDECFFVDKKRVEEVANLLLKKKVNLNFDANIRADYFTKGLITQDLLNKLKNCGFFILRLSPEFGSQKMRDFIKKDVTERDIITAVKMIKKSGLSAAYGFMTGFPTETKEDTLATVALAKKIYKLNRGITVIKKEGKIYAWRENSRISGPEIYRPYPGGELYDYLIKQYGWKSPETIDGWERYFKENTRYKIEDYPWIQLKPEYYAALQLYIKAGKLDVFTFFKRLTLPYPLKLKVASAVFYPFAKLRMLLNFFDFPIEYLLGRKMGLLKGLDL
jgi:anaerobic magnesium-protoporphyrin IX monomethyl ester cyclase